MKKIPLLKTVRLKTYPSYFLILLVLAACGIKQPVASQNEQQFGNVLVTSTPPGAVIFIDRQPTGKTTPDTLRNLPVGDQLLRVFIDGYSGAPDSQIVTVQTNETVNAAFDLVEISDPAVLIVGSFPAAADILVDGKFSGKFTPDTVIVAAGERNVRLEKSSFSAYHFSPVQLAVHDTASLNVSLAVQPAVLLESFANTSCLPCTTSARLLEEFEQQQPGENLVVIEYFTNWPNFSDPFYLHNPTDIFTRISYYAVSTVPRIYMAGTQSDPFNISNLTSSFETQQAQLDPDLAISMSRRISDSLEVDVQVSTGGDVPAGDLRLFVAVTENGFRFDQPPGANGLKRFTHVFRKFMTPNSGTSIAFVDKRFSMNLKTALHPDWKIADLSIIGFVQNADTKQVLQASKLK